MSNTVPDIEVLEVNKEVTSSAGAWRKVRVVHISDTHTRHDQYYESGLIPDGDILIHSGDFGAYSFKRQVHHTSDYNRQISNMNAFFNRLPHKHKIFVAGNHETNFPRHTADQIQADLPSAIYLQDSYVDLEGIRIYGSPWTGYRWFSLARAFTENYSKLHKKWDSIPSSVDVLVTHSPPYNVMDLAYIAGFANFWRAEPPCDTCGTTHVRERHFGSSSLLDTVLNRVR